MPRRNHIIQLGPDKDAPTQAASCRLSRAQIKLHELRQYYPQAFIRGLEPGTQGAEVKVLREPDAVVVLSSPSVAPVKWED